MKVALKVVFYVSTSIVLFLFVFSFIVQNPQNISIHYYYGIDWTGSVAIVLFLTLGVGMLLGVLASSLGLLKLKIRLIKTGKQLQALQSNHSLEREQIRKGGN